MKEEKLLKIINNYGIDNQLRQFTEEYFELAKAILEYENFIDYSPTDASSIEVNGDIFTMPKYAERLREHIAEELADVMVLIEQFKLYYGITAEEIVKIFWNKVDRTLERMEQ